MPYRNRLNKPSVTRMDESRSFFATKNGMSLCRRLLLIMIVAGLILQSVNLRAGGFEIRISPETGIFSQSAEIDSRDYLSTATSLTARYKYRFTKQLLVFDLKIKPEFYSGADDISVLNINGQASYKRSGEKLDMELALSRKQMNYYEGRFRLFAQMTQVTARTYLKISSASGISLQPKYTVRSLAGEHEHNLVSAMTDAVFVYRIRSSVVVSAGPVIEYYKIHIPYRAEPPSRNKGIAAGPTVQLSYQDGSVAQLSYALMKRTSDPVNESSLEHRIHGLLGRPLSKKWSAFFFLEYTVRDFRNNSDKDNELFYSLTDNENRVFAKISYEWKSGSEWFLKAGYLSYGLYQSSARLSGFQLTTGCDFKF